MSGLKRAFGFSPETEEEDEDYNPAPPVYAASAPASPAGSTESSPSDEPRDAEGDAEPGPDLLGALLDFFNSQQPEYVRSCIDLEAQKKLVLSRLPEGLRQHLADGIRESDNAANPALNWVEERAELLKKMEELKGSDDEMARLRRDNRKLTLSLERQKRALLDRINDLETQVLTMNQEKEKLLSSKVLGGDSKKIADLTDRVTELEAAISQSRSEQESLTAERDELKARCQEVSDATLSPEEIARLKDQISSLEEEVKRQSTLKEQLEVKTAMSDTMINDLRNQAAAARRELEQNVAEQQQIMDQIREQLDGFEALKERKDAKIAELQEANSELRRTIETNLYNQANSEMRLRSEIKALRQRLGPDDEEVSATASPRAASSEKSVPQSEVTDTENVPDEATTADMARKRRRGRPRKVRIDTDLDNTDWFAGGSKSEATSDFGYQEPPHRPVNDSEAQLSLF